MAYPPTVPPATATNATVSLDTHPLYHNQLAAALTQIPWGPATPPVQFTGSSAFTTGTTFMAAGWTLPAVTLRTGRRYRVTCSATMFRTGAGFGNCRLSVYRDGTSNGGTILGQHTGNNEQVTYWWEQWITGDGASHTFAVYIAADTNTVKIDGSGGPNWLALTDEGAV